jgi:hypothetical protein
MVREGNQTGIIGKLILLIIAFLLTYFLAYPLFILMWVIIILYIVYRFAYKPIKRLTTPKGMRIKHKMLKGYFTQKYGDEGTQMYKETVKTLRKRGYY